MNLNKNYYFPNYFGKKLNGINVLAICRTVPNQLKI